MHETIDRETFAHLVKLAALEMDEEKSEYVRRELNNQLKAISELEAIPVDPDIKPTIHGVVFSAEISQSLREDVPQPFEDRERIISQFPQSQDGYIVVPDIPHTTLE